MTRDKAIAELVRIWHSPHLDLSLKTGLAEAIEELKGADGVLEQIRWERDVALKTLEEHGIGFAEEPKTGEWIPVKWHEITDEEREREGYPKDWVVYIDCEMPCDEQEILVQTKSGCVRWDVCYEDGEYSLDSGWDWIEDIVAWMPLPEPYKGGESDE